MVARGVGRGIAFTQREQARDHGRPSRTFLANGTTGCIVFGVQVRRRHSLASISPLSGGLAGAFVYSRDGACPVLEPLRVPSLTPIFRNEPSTSSCRERSRERSASIENDTIARHIGNEGGIPFLQAA